MFAPDTAVLTWMAEHRTALATRLSTLLMSASGSVPLIAVFAVLAVGFVVIRHAWVAAIVVASATVIAVIVTNVLKILIARDRPPANLALVSAHGYSMPSTDGALTAAAATALVLVTTWSTRSSRLAASAILGAVVVVVGVCLVYLGAHWPTDVLAGWAVGALVAFGCHKARRLGRRASGSGRA